MAILLITHDLGIVRHMADRVYVMSDGEIVEHNTAEALFTAPTTPLYPHAPSRRTPGRTGSDRRGRARSHPHPQPQGPLSHQARSAAPHRGPCKSSRWNFAPYTRGADRRHCRRIRFGQDHAWARRSCGWWPAKAPSNSTAAISKAGSQKEIRPLRRQMQIVFQDPFRFAEPAAVGFSDYRGGPADSRNRRATTTSVGS